MEERDRKMVIVTYNRMKDASISYEEAADRPDHIELREAMEDRIRTIDQKDFWSLTDLSPGRKVMGTRWVLNVMRKQNGFIKSYEARLVAIEFLKKPGTDFGEIYAPVIKYMKLRMEMALIENANSR